MNLETVKEHFKNAKEVRCLGNGRIYDISDLVIEPTFYRDVLYANNKNLNVALLYKDKTFANIISYKEPIFTITKDQIITAHTDSSILPLLFPQFFKSGLVVGEWYKSQTKYEHFKNIFRTNDGIKCYGFTNEIWFENQKNEDIADTNLTKATPEEVETALFAEAKKRGFEDGVVANNSNIHGRNLNNNKLPEGNLKIQDKKLYWGFYEDEDYKAYCIFANGTWATIIPQTTLTRQQIADKFEIDVNNLIIE